VIEELSRGIVLWLSKLWNLHKTEGFKTHLMMTYGLRFDPLPTFECIYIAEAMEGDLEQASIGSIINKWWRIDDSGLSDVRRIVLDSDEQTNVFYKHPILKYYTDGFRIVFCERLGQNIISQKVGNVILKKGEVSVEQIQIMWISTA